MCLNTYSESGSLVPRVLPCGHTHCTGCSAKSANIKAKINPPDQIVLGAGRMPMISYYLCIQCPRCRKIHNFDSEPQTSPMEIIKNHVPVNYDLIPTEQFKQQLKLLENLQNNPPNVKREEEGEEMKMDFDSYELLEPKKAFLCALREDKFEYIHQCFEQHRDKVCSVGLSQFGLFVACGSEDPRSFYMNMEELILDRLEMNPVGVDYIVFGSSGRFFVRCADGTCHWWSGMVAEFDSLVENSRSTVVEVAFAKKGGYYVRFSNGFEVYRGLPYTLTAVLKSRPNAKTPAVKHIAVADNDQWMVVFDDGSVEYRLHFEDIKTDLSRIKLNELIQISLSPDGKEYMFLMNTRSKNLL